MLQTTATLRGIGLFTGHDAEVTFEPAPPGSGLQFAIDDDPPFPARIEHLSREPVHDAFARVPARHTALADPRTGRTVYTVEHALAALVGLGVRDALARVRTDGPKIEVPIMDGSAKPFTDAILQAGLMNDPTPPASPVRPSAVVRVPLDPDPDADPPPMAASARPLAEGETPTYAYALDYTDTFQAIGLPEPHPIRPAAARWTLGDRDAFLAGIAPARTFSLRQEVEPLRALGLFERFTPANMLVIGADGPIDNQWRLDDEPARHKLLDFIGDLALIGRPLAAHAEARAAGHALNHDLARVIRSLDAK
ncbi:MAG: hypothetical protein EA378_06340 [Phycisphaerales bacterium]|nr:MAG: hypothetical protein EA378_06340 [Phycisphaerales bacterium]